MRRADAQEASVREQDEPEPFNPIEEERMSRVRINVSLTEEGLAILDRERTSMGLSRSAMFEVLLRFWVRDQRLVAQDQLTPGGGSDAKAGRTRRSRKS